MFVTRNCGDVCPRPDDALETGNRSAGNVHFPPARQRLSNPPFSRNTHTQQAARYSAKQENKYVLVLIWFSLRHDHRRGILRRVFYIPHHELQQSSFSLPQVAIRRHHDAQALRFRSF